MISFEAHKIKVDDQEYPVSLPILVGNPKYEKGLPFQNAFDGTKVPIKMLRARIPYDEEKQDSEIK